MNSGDMPRTNESFLSISLSSRARLSDREEITQVSMLNDGYREDNNVGANAS